jgi:hypothetical protein
MPCLRCEAQPGFHSFRNLGKTADGHWILYSKPSLNVERTLTESTVENLLSHMDDASSLGTWVYLFDAQGLDKMEMPNIQLMRKFNKTVQERYRGKMVRVYIINKNWAFELVFNLLKPFMSKENKDLYIFCSSPLLLLKEGIPPEVVQMIWQ